MRASGFVARKWPSNWQPLPDGGLRIVWTSGFISEPTLYTLTIDGMGRPSFAEEVRFFVTHPALVRDGRGDLWLFWLWEGDVYRGRLVDTALEDVEVVTSDVALQRGDYLDAFYAVMDETHTYLLWQVSRADGSLNSRPFMRVAEETTTSQSFNL